MTWNFNTFLRLCTVLVPAVWLSACSLDREFTPRESVPVSLAVKIGSESPEISKGDPSTITEMNQNFRGITEVMLIPFDTQGEIDEEDRSNALAISLADITSQFYDRAVEGNWYAPGLVVNNRAHLYPGTDVKLTRKTASALVYAKSPVVSRATETEERHLNGILESSGFEPEGGRQSVSSIRFSPVRIFSSTIPAEAYGIAGILSDLIESASVTIDYSYLAKGIWRDGSMSVVWDENCPDSRLREYFKWFTNDGNITGGSGLGAEYMMTYLLRLLTDYSSYDETIYEHESGGVHYMAQKGVSGEFLTYADIYNTLRDYLLERFDTLVYEGEIVIEEGNRIKLTDSAQRSYPGSLGLPDGAAAILWTGLGFEVAEGALDGVAPISAYCYPPDLRYFANSTISTSTSDKDESYTSDKADWNSILNEYRGAKSVYSDTRSVALDEPLNYSCGMLKATVRGISEEVGHGTMFPLTGVIIGGQRNLRFDFSPVSGDEFFLYDNCINGIYLTPETSPEFRTLVSQTMPGENVYFCLEFRNDSGAAFSGADGKILPGCKFYLIGRIEPPEDNEDACIFMRDCTTSVNCLVHSLSEARNSIPDLEHPSLTMGVQLMTSWMQATSSYIVMY